MEEFTEECRKLYQEAKNLLKETRTTGLVLDETRKGQSPLIESVAICPPNLSIDTRLKVGRIVFQVEKQGTISKAPDGTPLIPEPALLPLIRKIRQKIELERKSRKK